MEHEAKQLVVDQAEYQAGDPWVDLLEDDLADCRRRGGGGGSGGPPIVSFRVYCIVEYVRLRGVDFDYQDVLEHGVVGILTEYGIVCLLSEGERVLLMDSLVELGMQRQTLELLRVAGLDDPALSQVKSGRSGRFSLRDEAAFRRVFLAGLRRKHHVHQGFGSWRC